MADIDPEKAAGEMGEAAGDCEFFRTPEEMLRHADLDGIMIGTRCSLHTEMALKLMPSGIPIFIEKPVATTMDDLRRLKQGYDTASSDVLVSFPLRRSSCRRFTRRRSI